MESAAAFESLCNQRDLAAYRLVGAVQGVLHFWEARTFDESFASLRRAYAEFEQADARISEFHKSHTGELKSHGNRSAA